VRHLNSFLRFVAAAAFLYSLLPNARAETRLMPGFTALPPDAKIVVMPLDVELYSMSAGGVVEPQAEWTTQALDNIKAALRARPHRGNVSFSAFPDDADPVIDDLNRLHGAVGAAINIHHLGLYKLPTKEGRLEWSLGPDVAVIKQKCGADYALFTFVRDSYASSERKVAMVVAAVFGVGLSAGVQIGYASLVDLTTGNVVWFNRLIRNHGDLRDAENARESVNALLEGLPD
jgi:hypothetical protein